MQLKLKELKELFNIKLIETDSIESLIDLEKDYLGKTWILNAFLKWIKDLSVEDKKVIGPLANDLKNYILEEIEKKKKIIEDRKFDNIKIKEAIDVTAEFARNNLWHKHPISITSKIIEDIFISMWYKVADGPQIELEEYNFDKLNIPDNHPAREVWDTFWISDDINSIKKPGERLLLRTHTSPVQAREMLKWEMPIKIIVPGRVFRYEQEDARHTCNFYQIEWLVVWEWVSFGDLKWTLETAMKNLFSEDTELRFRPSIFPFTEPSAEIDISCQLCAWKWEKDWKNCSMCSGTGWVELLGAWMVHPKVLEYCGIDPEKYSWFAFGLWIDRVATQKFSISSWRSLYQTKLKLNEQF